MPNQSHDQRRESARAERRRAHRAAGQPTSAAPAPAPSGSVRPGNDRQATTSARSEVVDARRRADARTTPSANYVAGPRQGHGPFAGRGPKGYQRDDRRIREDVCDRLLADSHVDASEIEVSVASGEVTLDGTVLDRATKHYVECIGAECAGVKDVQNNLRLQGARSTGRPTGAVTEPRATGAELAFAPRPERA